MKKVVAFGEIMLRLATENHLRFSQARAFNATYGGGEFNVAVSLANYGISSEFVTRLPDNEIGACALAEIKKRNVSSEHIIFGGDRLGIYFLETGAGTRGSNVVYDRANSAIATIERHSIDWESVLKDACWFHWSGVTPALSQNTADECLNAVKTAHQMGLTVSADLNYRAKLWKYGKAPKDVIPELLHYSNIILGDLDTAFFMLGKDKVSPDYQDENSLPELYDMLFEYCPNLNIAATTLRYSVSASHQKIGGILYSKGKLYSADIREVTPVIDRIGSGDAFMGGLIYGLLKNEDDKQNALDVAVAACCLKHTIYGDYNLITIEEIESMIYGNASGKVSR